MPRIISEGFFWMISARTLSEITESRLGRRMTIGMFFLRTLPSAPHGALRWAPKVAASHFGVQSSFQLCFSASAGPVSVRSRPSSR